MTTVKITNKNFDVIKEVIDKANNYIKIVSFLFYDEKLCDLLIQKYKSNNNIKIEIITTPPDAAEKEEVKIIAKKIQDKLRMHGIEVFSCDLEVGQPELTISTRAGGRIPKWYLMHSKFLVTDKHAIIMSSDITQDFSSKNNDWNSYIIYDNPKIVELVYEKFGLLKQICTNIKDFVNSRYMDASVEPRKLIKGYPYNEIHQKTINIIDSIRNYYLQKYFQPTLEENSNFNEKIITPKNNFYLLPHEVFGREIINQAIEDANEFIYLIYETIYDDDLTFLFIKKLIKNPQIDFKIITTSLRNYVQNKNKVKATFLQLASYGAKIRIMNHLKAKMLITDKLVISGSFDLVKMGIGLIRKIKTGNTKEKVIVGSTEIMNINLESQFIKKAKNQFLKVFEMASEEMHTWFKKDAENILRAAGAKLIDRKAKEMFSYMILHRKRIILVELKIIALIAVEIAKLRNKKRPYVKEMDIKNAETIYLYKQKQKNIDADIIRDILEIDKNKASSFIKQLKNLKIL